MTWIESVQDHIIANVSGVELNKNIFIDGMEDGEHVTEPTLGIAEYGGPIAETTAPGIQIKEPQLHIAVRGKSYTETKERIENVFDLLSLVTNTTVEGTKFMRIKPSQTVMSLGRDKQGRYQFSVNFDVML